MEITESRLGQTTILELEGDLDQRATASLEKHADELLAAGDRHLLLNLGPLDTVDAAGVRCIFGLSRRLAAQHGQLVLCSLKPEVREALQVTGLEFTIRSDRAAALQLLPTGSRISRIARAAARLLSAGNQSPPPKAPGPKPVGPTPSGMVRISSRAKELLAGPPATEATTPEPPPPEQEEEPEPEASGGWGRVRRNLDRLLSKVRSP